MDLASIANGIVRGEDGIWRSTTTGDVSYPSDGNSICADVEDSSFWYRHRAKVLELIMELYPTAPWLLDIGGGNGVVSADLSSRGLPAVLLNPDPEGVRNARLRGIKDVICGRLEDVGFAADVVPAIGLFDVLEHIPDDGAFLDTCHNILSPTGHLYLTVPANQALWSRHDEVVGHCRRYSSTALESVLDRAGFKTLYLTYFFSSLLPVVAIVRALPFRLGVTRSLSGKGRARQHRSGQSATGRVLQAVLQPELAVIRSGRRLPFGTSIVAVATPNAA